MVDEEEDWRALLDQLSKNKFMGSLPDLHDPRFGGYFGLRGAGGVVEEEEEEEEEEDCGDHLRQAEGVGPHVDDDEDSKEHGRGRLRPARAPARRQGLHPREEDEGRYWRVRMRVLRAIVKCRSIKRMSLLREWGIGEEREEELLVLLQGLASKPILNRLEVIGCEWFGRRPATCEALGQLLASSRILGALSLCGVGLKAAGLDVLADGLRGCRLRLMSLDLSENEVGDGEGAQQLALILATAPELTHLRLNAIGMDVAGARVIANALLRSSNTLEYLELGQDREVPLSSPSGSGLGPLSTLLKLAFTQADENNASVAGITSLTLRIRKEGEAGLADALGGMLRTNARIWYLETTPCALIHGLEALRYNSTISRLRCLPVECETDTWMPLVPLLQQCKALRVLDLQLVANRGHASFMKALLKSLEDNSSLQTLYINSWEDLTDDMFADLMHSLEVNRTLRDITLRDETTLLSSDLEAKVATIRRALARNATQQAYLPLLLDGQEPVRPKAGRLFLCGAPFAGKTTLRKSLIRAWKLRTASPFQRGQVRLQENLSSYVPQSMSSATDTRTEGIEIEVLRNDNYMRVTIWDLAGQAHYRALQQYLFPTSNQPCVFVFAFSPFDGQHPGTLDLEMLKKLRTTLAFWLRFINSNCRNLAFALPRMFVVVTHVDQMEASHAGTLPDVLKPVLTELAAEFKQVVHVETTALCMDARYSKTVKPLLYALMISFRDSFRSRRFEVPEVCNQLSAVLTDWVSKNPAKPIVKKQEFQILFQHEIQSLQKAGVQDDEQRILGGILAYLHDVGNIIWFQKLDIVVVNPHWISHTFLGRLIHLLTKSQPSSTSIVLRSSDGFVAEGLLHSTLDEILRGTQAGGIKREELVSLMLTLNLCYKADVTQGIGFFVPFTLDDGNGQALQGKRQLAWKIWDTACNAYNHVGRRLQCRDTTKTFLGPGLFPRFQVSLQKDLLTKLDGMQDDDYSIGRNLINFYYDGMEIFLESGDIEEHSGDIGDHIDILIRSSTKDKDQIIEFVKGNVIAQLKTFCSEASSGVDLVEGVIRTKCVEDLTVCIYRRSQSVLIERLMKQLFRDAKVSVGEIFSSLDLGDYQTRWPAVPEASLQSVFEGAKELLGATEILGMLEERRTGLSQTISRMDKAAGNVLPEQQDIPRQTSGFINIQRTLSFSDRSQLGKGEELLLDTINEGFEVMENRLKTIEGKVDRIAATMQVIKDEISNIKNAQQQTLKLLFRKMDEIMDFVADVEGSKIPSRPYFTTADVGVVQKLLAGVRVGTAVKLHLMCENIHGHHIVEGQSGFDLTLEDAKWSWVRPIAINGAKLLVFLANAGLHAAAGLGGLIPDPFSGSNGAASVTGDLLHSILPDASLNLTGPVLDQNTPVQEAWSCLKQVLEPFLKDQMPDKFQLYKVRCLKRPQGEQGVAWVCKTCMDKGRNAKIYKPF